MLSAFEDVSILRSCWVDESDTYVLERFNTTARNPVKEILPELNLPDHMSILMDSKAQVQFDQALRASLEKVVTASGPGFGDWQWRLATLLIKLGGLGILSARDIIRYAFLASRLQTSALQDKILMKTGIDSHGYSFQHAFDAFNTTCNVDVLSVTGYLVSKYSLSPRQVAILSCIRAPHAQDFLFTTSIDGLGQRMNHRQFRSVLCYRLAVPMFSEGSLCPSCNAHQMDQWGDHVVHYSSEMGVKFRHNLVRDILVDICSKVGIMVRKEGPMGFLSEEGKNLRPADLLLFNWLQGKDACLDVTCISPFAGMGATACVPGAALHNAVEKKKRSMGPYVRKTDTSSYHLPFLRLGNSIRMLWTHFLVLSLFPLATQIM
ncbi:hypothetical protein Tco_0394079 [Tanacetum coccineum]